jgi:hypothetical protein
MLVYDFGVAFEAIQLRRAIIVRSATGWGCLPISVDLFDDVLRISYVIPEFEVPDEKTWLGGDFDVSDDVGTRYTPRGGSASGVGGSRSLHGFIFFTPAVPVTGSELAITGTEGILRVDLRA